MNVLILGGTGAMGAHLAAILASPECSIYVTTRSKRLDSSYIRYLIGNAHDLEFLKKILKEKEWDAIVDFMYYQTDEFEKKCSLFLESTKQYVFLSSSRVYASSKDLLKENSPRLLDVCSDKEYISLDEYALAKARQENILQQSGCLNWTIIRPYITFGESKMQLSCEEKESWLYRAMHGRSIVFSKDLACRRTTVTYGADVARGIASIIGKKEALGEFFHITNNESYCWSEILFFYLNALEIELGFRPKVVELDRYERFMGGGAYQVKYDRLYDRAFDNSKINAFVDTNQFMNTCDAIRLCVHNFLKNPNWQHINWVHEAMKDRLSNEWISIKEWLHIPGVKQKIKYILIRSGFFISRVR